MLDVGQTKEEIRKKRGKKIWWERKERKRKKIPSRTTKGTYYDNFTHGKHSYTSEAHMLYAHEHT